jgi:hypothetical protein
LHTTGILSAAHFPLNCRWYHSGISPGWRFGFSKCIFRRCVGRAFSLRWCINKSLSNDVGAIVVVGYSLPQVRINPHRAAAVPEWAAVSIGLQTPPTAAWEQIMPSLKQAYIRILLASVALVLGTLLVAGRVVVGIGATVVFIVFALEFLSGAVIWSMYKGRPGWLGVMLGLFGPLGLIVLVFLNDKSQKRD